MKRMFSSAMVAIAMLAIVACGGKDDDPDPLTGGWVDLELPSGLLWAEHNLGAIAQEDFGDYYAWGEIVTKNVYDWETYHYCTTNEYGNLVTLTKYNTKSDYGTIDNLSALETIDDVAASVLGSGARIPTRDEWMELVNHTTVEWTTVNDVAGYKFTGSNGKSIFVPAAGRRYDSSLWDSGEEGFYWSSTLHNASPDHAWALCYRQGYYSVTNEFRYRGHSIRPVKAKAQ
ncbi:MAG: hypothetical protein IJM88_07955 [Bacteroidales bacterium]|nr:hypothetical protein [Bacteroidales bacterium]